MANQFREVSSTSWGQRILGSFVGALIGIVCVIGAFVLLWWGEGRSIERAKALDEGRGIVVSVSSETVDASHDGALVHISGRAETSETLRDKKFGIAVNALRLERTVQMYQWKEDKDEKTEDKLGGGQQTVTTYDYKTDWSENLIDSSDFKHPEDHQNPANMPLQSQMVIAKDIHVGAFDLTQPFVEQLSNFTPYTPSDEEQAAMDAKLKAKFTLNGDEFFSGNTEQPKVGDLRVKYAVILPGDVSVIGKQDGHQLVSYPTKNGTLELLETGIMDAPAMFSAAEDENKMLTWLLRLGGTVAMWIGLGLILSPMRAVGAVIPFVGSLLGAGIALVSGVFAFVISAITIAVAWLFYRPIIGVSLLVMAAALFFGGYKMIRQKLQKT